MKKSFCKKMLTMALALVLVLGSVNSAFACTGVYVGSGVTENGSSYFGRSEDIGDLYGKVFGVAQPQAITDESVFEDTYGFSMKYSDLEFDYPETTYSYTYARDSYNYGETMLDADGNYIGEAYAEVGQNEKGVAMTATVSTSYNWRTVHTVDPLVGTGIYEISMTSILLGGAATAKEAVDLLAEIIDKYGAGECNSLMIGDANETWYFEIVSGHQYAAIKLPADKVSVQPNIMLMDAIDVTDTENVVVSDDLVSLAEENGFLVTDENGNIDVSATYGSASGSSKRYYQGVYYFNDAVGSTIDPTSTFDYSLLFDTNKTLTTMDVLKLLAFRGEGSAWDHSADPNSGNGNMIGTARQSECHIFETRQDMPELMAVLQWQCMADAEFGIYVPYYTALVTEASELYDTEVIPKKVDKLAYDTEGQINTNFHLINNLCDMNRQTDPEVAAAVKAYFEEYQQSLIDQQKDVDAVMKEIYAHGIEGAKAAATALHKDLAKQVSDMSSAVLAEIRAYFSAEEKPETFALSEAVTAMMPVYTVAEELLPEHDYDYESDEDGHWEVCSICGNTTEAAEHEFEAAFDENGHWTECSVCEYATEAIEHELEAIYDENGHWSECADCEYAGEAVAHELEAAYDEVGHWTECADCEYATEAVAHELAYESDDDTHWTVCGDCEYISEAAEHEFVDGACACGEAIEAAPDTGDTFNIGLYTGMLILSALAAAAVVVKTKKQKA